MAGYDDLTEDERAAIVTAARRQVIDRDRYPLSPRLKPFKTALEKLDPASAPKPAVERHRYQRRRFTAVAVLGPGEDRLERD